VGRLSRKYRSLDVSQPYGPSRSVTGITLPSFAISNLMALMIELFGVWHVKFGKSAHLERTYTLCMEYLYLLFISQQLQM
jgi:hypothetical protein